MAVVDEAFRAGAIRILTAVALLASSEASARQTLLPLFPGPLSQTSYGAAIVATGDMNGDGSPDVVTTDLNGSIAVAKAQGKSFALPVLTNMPQATYFHALGDLDGDGVLDVVAAGADDRVYVFRGLGNGTFAVPTNQIGGASGWALAVGDLDNDGKLDVVTVDHLGVGAVSVLRGAGNGTLLSKHDYPCASLPYQAVIADADADGKLDVVVACNTSPTGVISFLRGTGAGALAAPQSYSSGNSTHAAVIGDFDNDSHPDIAGANVLSNDITILRGTGLSGAQAFVPAGSALAGAYPAYLTTLDANSDGKLDLAVCNEFGNSATVILGKGNATFQSGVAYVTTGAPATIAAADFDLDSRVDLVTAHANGDDEFTTLYGKGDGSFLGATVIATTHAYPFCVASGDLNEDGKPDVVSANYCGVSCGDLSVFLGTGNSAFSSATSYSTGFGPEWVALADVDLDHHLDAVVANYQSASVSVLHGNGLGGFTTSTSLPLGGSPTHLVVRDMNGDGAPDLVVCSYTSASVLVYRNVGGAFQLAQTLPTGNGSGPTKAAVGDLNHDGRQDLVVALGGFNYALAYFGLPNGNLSAATSIPIGATQRVLALADLNDDGNLDLATNGVSGGLREVFGTGTGSFGAPIDVTSDAAPHDLAAGDVDGDGKVDLVSVGSALAIELGNGMGGFAQAGLFAVSASPYGLALVDLDGDGRQDVVTANYNSANVEILKGARPLPAGVVAYGAGTGGCQGRLGMGASPSPQVGQSAFTFTTTNAPPNAHGFLIVGTAPLLPGSNVFGVGIAIEVSPFAPAFFVVDMQSDACGAGSLHVPIPSSVPAGFKAYAQSVWTEAPGFQCSASPYSLVSSRGIEITILP